MTTQPVAAYPATTERADKDFTERVRVATNAYVLQGLDYPAPAYVRSYPDDLTPSLLAKAMAHAGAFLEFAAPLTLLFVTHEGPLLWLGMTFVVLLHGFILSNLPLAAVFEWNVLSVFVAFFLFAGHPTTGLFDVGSGPLTLYLLAALLVLPLVGNLAPHRVSFLVAMRYYAGNWAWNAWLGWNFREGHLADERLIESIREQCGFEEGELRVICVEAQPILGSTLHWRIVDGKRGKLAEGHAELSDLARRKPWDVGVA